MSIKSVGHFFMSYRWAHEDPHATTKKVEKIYPFDYWIDLVRGPIYFEAMVSLILLIFLPPPSPLPFLRHRFVASHSDLGTWSQPPPFSIQLSRHHHSPAPEGSPLLPLHAKVMYMPRRPSSTPSVVIFLFKSPRSRH
jgi:hypothetical protein